MLIASFSHCLPPHNCFQGGDAFSLIDNGLSVFSNLEVDASTAKLACGTSEAAPTVLSNSCPNLSAPVSGDETFNLDAGCFYRLRESAQFYPKAQTTTSSYTCKYRLKVVVTCKQDLVGKSRLIRATFQVPTGKVLTATLNSGKTDMKKLSAQGKCSNDFLKIKNIDEGNIVVANGGTSPPDTGTEDNSVRICGAPTNDITYTLLSSSNELIVEMFVNGDTNTGKGFQFEIEVAS